MGKLVHFLSHTGMKASVLAIAISWHTAEAANVISCPEQSGPEVARIVRLVDKVVDTSFPDLQTTPISVCIDREEKYFQALPRGLRDPIKGVETPMDRYIIAVTDLVLGKDGLDDPTLEAVFAHELGHISTYTNINDNGFVQTLYLAATIVIPAKISGSFHHFSNCYEKYVDFTSIQRGYSLQKDKDSPNKYAEGLATWFSWVTTFDPEWAKDKREKKYLSLQDIAHVQQRIDQEVAQENIKTSWPLNHDRWMDLFFEVESGCDDKNIEPGMTHKDIMERGFRGYRDDFQFFGPQVSVKEIYSHSAKN